MGKAIKLTAADLAGATPLDGGGPIKLSAADLEGASYIDGPAPVALTPQQRSAFGSSSPAAAPLPEDRQAAIDTKIKGGLERIQGTTPDETLALAKSSRVIPTTTKALSFGAAAADAGSFFMGDEISGAINAALDGKPFAAYERERNTVRDQLKYAAEANPTASFFGGLTGGLATSFLPGLGAARGASLFEASLAGARAGGVAGFGASEADNPLDLALDTAKSAALSGALTYGTGQIAGKVIGGAPERVEKRLLGEVTEGAPKTLRDRLVGKGGRDASAVVDLVRREPEVAAAARLAKDSPEKALPRIQVALDSATAKLDDRVYDPATKALGGGGRVSDVIGAIEGVAKKYDRPGTASLAAALRGEAETVLNEWGNAVRKPLREIRQFATDLGDKAYAGSPGMPVNAAKQASQDMERAVRGVIDDAVDEAQRLGAPVNKKEMHALNGDVKALVGMKRVFIYRATGEATPSTRLKVIGQQLLSAQAAIGAGTGALASGHMIPAAAALGGYAATKAVQHAVMPVVRLADYQLARLVNAARNGSTVAKLAQTALEWGVAPQAARAVAEMALRAGTSQPVKNAKENLRAMVGGAPPEPAPADDDGGDIKL